MSILNPKTWFGSIRLIPFIDEKTGEVKNSDQKNNNTVPALNQAVGLIVNALLSFPIKIEKPDGEEDTEHEFNPILQDPNPFLGRDETYRKLYTNLVYSGDAFAPIIRGGRPVKIIGFMPADLMDAQWYHKTDRQNRRYPKYKLQRVDEPAPSTDTYYEAKELVRFHSMGFDGLKSWNPAIAVKTATDPIVAVRNLITNTVTKASGIRDIVQTDSELLKGLDEEQMKEFYRSINNALYGTKTTGIFPAGATLMQRTGVGLIDSSMIALEEAEIVNIARIFNIAPRYLGITRNIRVSTELTEQSEDFLKITLSPHIRSIESGLRRLAAQAGYPELKIVLDTTEFARGSTATRAPLMTGLYQAGLVSQEEARSYIGFPEEMIGSPAPLLPGAMPAPENEENPENNQETDPNSEN